MNFLHTKWSRKRGWRSNITTYCLGLQGKISGSEINFCKFCNGCKIALIIAMAAVAIVSRAQKPCVTENETKFLGQDPTQEIGKI